MSRPRKSREASLSHRITFRLKANHYVRLNAQAKIAGLSVHQLARKLACSRSDALIIRTSARMDPAFIAHLRRIGQLLNQLVHNAHIFGHISPQIGELCDKISDLIENVTDRDGE